MFRCFGGGFHQDSVDSEVAWLKRMLQNETLQRKAAQEQLCQEQAKCALLEQEIQQAAAAAHEMGESLRQFFSRAGGSDCSNPSTQWVSRSFSCLSDPALGADTPQSTDRPDDSNLPHTDLQRHLYDTNTTCDQRLNASAPAPKHASCPSSSRIHADNQPQEQQTHARQCQQLRHQPRSSCSSTTRESQIRCSSQNSNMSEFSPLLTRQPSLSHRSSAKMRRHVLQVADQLKGLAMSWQQRLEDYQPMHDRLGAATGGESSSDQDAQCGMTPALAGGPPAAAAAGTGVAHTSSRLREQEARAVPPSARNSWAVKQPRQQQQCQVSRDSLQEQTSSSASQPPSASCDWGSSSNYTDNQSSSTAVGPFDGNADVSSSTGSFVRYRSSYQHFIVGEIAEGDEGIEQESDQHEEEQPQPSNFKAKQEIQSVSENDQDSESATGLTETDSESEAQQLLWHAEQLDKQQVQSQLHKQVPRDAAQHTQLQYPSQPQYHVASYAWNRQTHDAVAAGCAITRGAVTHNSTPNSTIGLRTPGSTAAGSLCVPRGPSPLSAGAVALGMKAMPTVYTNPLAQQQQQCNAHASQDSGAWQQQPQQQTRHQQFSLRHRGVEVVPQDLKCMAPLRRHQQYLSTSG